MVVVVLIVAENLVVAVVEIEPAVAIAVVAVAAIVAAAVVVVNVEVAIDYEGCLSCAMMNCLVVIEPMNQYCSEHVIVHRVSVVLHVALLACVLETLANMDDSLLETVNLSYSNEQNQI